MADKSDDIISLEELIGGDSGSTPVVNHLPNSSNAPPGSSNASNSPASSPHSPYDARAAKSTESTSDLDRILASVDPGFSESMKELAELGQGADIADHQLENLVQRSFVEAHAKGWRKFVLLAVKRPLRALLEYIKTLGIRLIHLLKLSVPAAKEVLVWAIKGARSGALSALSWIGKTFKALLALDRRSKLFMFIAVLLSGLTLQVSRVILRDDWLPSFGSSFLTSFSDIADTVYKIAPNEPWDNFNDPMFHVERVVLLERIIVNLRSQDNGDNPMALVDLYIEGSSNSAAIELADRELEVRDVISRTLEQVPYAELMERGGKEKFKVMVRKNLNGLLSHGRVRRVYFKNIVIKS